MKSIVKLRLINWHYFGNTTTDIKRLTFLTGPNGTGKSTIIDAMQILILGTTRPDNFNKAANEKGRQSRTLLSYLRGQTGIADDGTVMNLRPGNFTSYIALEISDDTNGQVFTLGVVFDVDAADNVDKHYFYLDSPFPENDFTSEQGTKKARPMTYPELSRYVRENYKANHFRFFDTDISYQLFIHEIFGNLPDKYFSLFKKAVSFAPIDNISSFITEYICDVEKQIDIAPMQNNIENYKILEYEAKRLKTKAENLQTIQNTYQSMRSFDKKLDLLKYINDRVSFEEGQKKVQILEERLEKDNKRLLAISDEIAQFDRQIEELRQDLSSYQAKKLQSKNYSLTEKLSLKKEGNNILTMKTLPVSPKRQLLSKMAVPLSFSLFSYLVSLVVLLSTKEISLLSFFLLIAVGFLFLLSLSLSTLHLDLRKSKGDFYSLIVDFLLPLFFVLLSFVLTLLPGLKDKPEWTFYGFLILFLLLLSGILLFLFLRKADRLFLKYEGGRKE